MRRLMFALIFAGCGETSSFTGDVMCSDDTGCASPSRCVHVSAVLARTGDCLESEGAMVCRIPCPEGGVPRACGCQ